MMTYDEAVDCTEPCSVATARRVLAQHYCRIVREDGARIVVSNDCDPEETIDCTPAAIVRWLGY